MVEVAAVQWTTTESYPWSTTVARRRSRASAFASGFDTTLLIAPGELYNQGVSMCLRLKNLRSIQKEIRCLFRQKIAIEPHGNGADYRRR